MKALSVRLPWAARIEARDKTLEIRSWKTKYRGPLVICMAKGVDHNGMARVGVFDFKKSMNARGRALCIVDLVDCRPMTPDDEKAAMVPHAEGSYAWVLENVRPVPGIPVNGQLGLFEIELPEGYS